MGRLDGKVALVSGGARGMGASHCRAIVANGGSVVIGDILDDEGASVAHELGESAVYAHLDVTKADEWEAAVNVAVEVFGKLNVLVNNAGIVDVSTLDMYSQEMWDTIISINLTGQFLGIKAAAAALVAAAPSSVVNISSIAGMAGYTFAPGYCASKFGVRGLTKSVSLELGPQGVRANSVHPGVIRTPMTAGMGEVTIGSLDRMGEPEDVSNLVVFLASDESSFSTGSEFVIDGGHLAGTAPPGSP